MNAQILEFRFLEREFIMLKLSILILAFSSLGCSSSDRSEKVEQNTPVTVTQAEMQGAAKSLISGFMGDLKAELMSAVKEGGVASAINVCQVTAPQVADSFSQGSWSIKRVTEKPRNQLNEANLHEQEILGMFADSLEKLDFYDEWTDSENETGYTFYKPIKVGKFCLKCHGDSKTLAEEVTTALQDKYPNDKATNYQAGDLRGMFVVRIENKEDVPLLQQALQDSL